MKILYLSRLTLQPIRRSLSTKFTVYDTGIWHCFVFFIFCFPICSLTFFRNNRPNFFSWIVFFSLSIFVTFWIQNLLVNLHKNTYSTYYACLYIQLISNYYASVGFWRVRFYASIILARRRRNINVGSVKIRYGGRIVFWISRYYIFVRRTNFDFSYSAKHNIRVIILIR